MFLARCLLEANEAVGPRTSLPITEHKDRDINYFLLSAMGQWAAVL